ncbi:uncharacterized protein LOC105842893 [Bombyx mori]|uniref:Uncharacterized protein n=1 Tax=Bombyx mori TaxID=7091 RepID=A0A8R2R409_BOMMO|nr:uncharacterized protein LOC105842893 [Bombyx mori]
MNLEEIHTILKAVTGSEGVSYAVTKEYFTRSGIIDGRMISESLFDEVYERLSPNREHLDLSKFIQLFGMLARNTRQDVEALAIKFDNIKESVIDGIRKGKS